MDILSFDLLNPPKDYCTDPYPILADLRRRAPVHRNPDGTYVLTRYADLVTAYRDPSVWSSDKRASFFPKFGDSPLFEHHTTSVVFTDPPDHTRIRALFQHAFTRKALTALTPRIEALVDTCLDRLEERGQMEVVTEFSFNLTIAVVCDMLGVPASDRELLRGWALAILTALEPTLTAQQRADGDRAVTEFKAYLRALLRHRRAHPDAAEPGEILTVLADAEADGQKLSEIELLHQCIFMLNAGHETSTNMISHGIHEMLRHPDQIARLRADPALIEPMVDEVLRFQAPIQINNRTAKTDTELGGVAMAAGTTIHMMVAAANRDPAQFPEPDRFDIGRRPNRHLSFALGIHICAGNTLARVEAAIAFEKLFARFPNLRLAGPAVIADRLRFREISHLPIACR